MNPDTNDRSIAVVLAGTRGLGYACAEAIGARGTTVLVCGRTADALEEAVGRLIADGIDAHGVVADVTAPADLAALFEAAADLDGSLDVLVANAGGPPAGGFDAIDDEAWAAAFELTFMSVVRSVRLALPLMRASGGGRIVVIGSSSTRRPIPNLTLSNALRPGLAGLVKSLSVELGGEGITVNMVSPGRIATARTQALDERNAQVRGLTVEEVRAGSVAAIPAGRYGDPGELGELVAFLTSPAGSYISGQTIAVDGAMVATLP